MTRLWLEWLNRQDLSNLYSTEQLTLNFIIFKIVASLLIGYMIELFLNQ